MQGDVLAQFLFIFLTDFVLSRSEQEFGFVYELQKSSRIKAKRINDLDFTEDIVLLENNVKLANQQLERIRVEADKVGLEINEKKTEVMTFCCDLASFESGRSLLKRQ